MPEGLSDKLKAALQGTPNLAGALVKREEDGAGGVVWDVRGGPLGLAMVFAAVAGFAVASTMAGSAPSAPPVAKTDPAPAPSPRQLQIQVRSEPVPRPVAPAAVIPVEQPAPAPPPARAEIAAIPAPAPPPVQARQSTPAASRPFQLAARTVSIPIALPAASRTTQDTPRADDDPEIAAAERETALAYRRRSGPARRRTSCAPTGNPGAPPGPRRPGGRAVRCSTPTRIISRICATWPTRPAPIVHRRTIRAAPGRPRIRKGSPRRWSGGAHPVRKLSVLRWS